MEANYFLPFLCLTNVEELTIVAWPYNSAILSALKMTCFQIPFPCRSATFAVVEAHRPQTRDTPEERPGWRQGPA